MTRQRSFKRLVRIRMDKTGESYTAARAALLAADATSAGKPALTMSDAAIRRSTGRGWEAWFDLLDEWGATDRTHTEVARWLAGKKGVDGWHAQAVTVSYERAREGRAVGERPDGFSITASKTIDAPVDRLYEAFTDASKRRRWLPEGGLRVRTSSKPKSARFDWRGGETRVNVGFTPKSKAKSSVGLAHERLPDAEEAERMKTFWRERMAKLKEVLEP